MLAYHSKPDQFWPMDITAGWVIFYLLIKNIFEIPPSYFPCSFDWVLCESKYLLYTVITELEEENHRSKINLTRRHPTNTSNPIHNKPSSQ